VTQAALMHVKEYAYKQNKRTDVRTSIAYIHVSIYTGCPRRNVPEFGRVFLMLTL